MAAALADLVRQFRDEVYSRRAQDKHLCKCSGCEQEVPLHERPNFVSLRTFSRHKRLRGSQGIAHHLCSDRVASYQAALGLQYGTQLMEEAVAQQGQSPAAGSDPAPFEGPPEQVHTGEVTPDSC